MKNVTLIKLRLRKAERNLQDYIHIAYMDGIISGDDNRYKTIWEDYRLSRDNLIQIDEEFFSQLDEVSLPGMERTGSFFDRNRVIQGYPANSRSTIRAAIENALHFISEYESMNSIPNETRNETAESAELIIQMMTNWSNMISAFGKHRKDVNPIQVGTEYDMQYLLEGILRLFFNDVRPETYTPNYGNKSNRTDFLLPKHKILIETKMTRDGLNDAKLSEELIIDKEHYRKHPDIDIILCFVYDPERRIKNPEGVKDIQELAEPPYFSIYFSN